MNTLKKIIDLTKNQDIRISEHGYDELSNDDLTAREVVSGILDAVLLEDYPDYKKGASYWYCKKIKRVNQFMSYGESLKAMKVQRF